MRKRVLVGISGGVDSSVAAALLKRSGYDVAGAFMKCWDDREKGCAASDDEYMARAAAKKIGIPLYVFDFRKEYKKRVFRYFIESYRAGITPNPDIMCNKEIKFGLLFDKAMELGFDFLATGHYARLRDNKLLEAMDKNKDQSYFLCGIKQERLEKLIFPIGKYNKSGVRKMAKDFGLPNADRPDSQGICFVGRINVSDFLKKRIKAARGDIVDPKGRVLGEHEGLAFYTIGQRKGIRLSGGPFYVVGKDAGKNRLIVSFNENDLLKKELLAGDVNWISEKKLQFPLKADVRIRYRQELASATIEKKGNFIKVLFKKPQRAVTPGQFVAFYLRKELLGGGVIL